MAFNLSGYTLEEYAGLLMRAADILDSLKLNNSKYMEELEFLSVEIRGLATILINHSDTLSKSLGLLERLSLAIKIILNK